MGGKVKQKAITGRYGWKGGKYEGRNEGVTATYKINMDLQDFNEGKIGSAKDGKTGRWKIKI